MCFKVFPVIIIILNFSNLSAYQSKLSENSSKFHNSDADVSFSGDKGKKKGNNYILNGHVTLSQENTTLQSDTATLYYIETKTNKMKLDKAVAKGHVTIKKTLPEESEFKAICEEVTLLPNKNLLILTGNAKVWRDDEFVHAKTIEVDTITGNLKLDDPRGKFATKKPE